jgi:hypothetical protein
MLDDGEPIELIEPIDPGGVSLALRRQTMNAGFRQIRFSQRNHGGTLKNPPEQSLRCL